jgi:hypothetical protein
VYHHHNVEQNGDIKIANDSFKNAENFEYSGKTMTNEICDYKEIALQGD